jgi:Spy/CpxP family protein refolding chaperone
MKIKTKVLVMMIGVFLMGLGSVSARMCSEGKMEGKWRSKMEGHSSLGEMGMHMPWDKIDEELSLSKKQKKAIESFKHENMKEIIKIKTDLKLKKMDLGYELKQDEIDDKKINGLIEDISAVHKKMLYNKVNSLKKFKSILTKEQWEKFRELKTKMHKVHDKGKSSKKKKRKEK